MNDPYSILMDELESIEVRLNSLKNKIQCIYPDQPRYYIRQKRDSHGMVVEGKDSAYVEAIYEILTPKNSNMRYVVPHNKNIPQEYWDKEINSKVIAWRVEDGSTI